jgi:hypothetical protein
MSTFTSIDHGHPLKLTLNPYKNNTKGWTPNTFQCNTCRITFKNTPNYHCAIELYDKCMNCVEKECTSKGIQFKVKSTTHDHPLQLMENQYKLLNAGWGKLL